MYARRPVSLALSTKALSTKLASSTALISVILFSLFTHNAISIEAEALNNDGITADSAQAGLNKILVNDTPANTTTTATNSAQKLNEQRALYLEVRKKLKQKKLTYDQVPYDQLEDYPLVPYLHYSDLISQLNKRPYKKVEQFLEENEDSWLSHRLRKAWLKKLASSNRWHEFQSYYDESIKDEGLYCQYLMARFNHGEPKALESVAPIWNQGKSLPKACDPLFKEWMQSEYFSSEIAWERHFKAVEARKLSLAKYISKKIDPALQPLAKQMRDLYHYPSRLSRLKDYTTYPEAELQSVMLYGVRRLARTNPKQALRIWEQFDSSVFFEQDERSQTIEHLAYRLLQKKHPKTATQILDSNNVVSDRVMERLIRVALKENRWQDVSLYIGRLSDEEQHTHRWRYWQARANEHLAKSEAERETITTIYQELAQDRDFYGFLAADRLGSQYSLDHTDVTPSPMMIEQVAQRPALARSKELYEIGHINQARMEWRYGTQDLSKDELLSAAKLANQWGWHRKTIESMSQARFWDDLNLRFPLVYQNEVNEAAKSTSLAPQYLLAIARQESAFAPDAKSPAGAMGLMQLMPATARETAKKIGITTHRKNDLLTPQYNITIGSNYLSQMVERFNGNRILATAAYNAGPHRVVKWLNPSGKEVPYDIWIETIPFHETRGYVQNVLSYSLIYSLRMGKDARLLEPKEVKQDL
ncbi:lytic transglycosylase [Marinibactrum halimedae]|uniref:Lytic transglycosylase n=1 Tax=Marinibactrum halimedae TaxID=1444977 RepID=A0AA37T986_9GAMM|nr:lytic transglycosylase [Marinibactrum halimedae]